jgi:dCMP deaminase
MINTFDKLTSKWDEYFLGMAEYVSKQSKDPSTKVGAVIVDVDGRVISTGYNSLPFCVPDDEKLLNDRERKYEHIIHAEENAVYFANADVKGACLYTWPFLCCIRCANRMLQVGIERFVAPELPKGHRWHEQLEESKGLIKLAGRSFKTYE